MLFGRVLHNFSSLVAIGDLCFRKLLSVLLICSLTGVSVAAGTVEQADRVLVRKSEKKLYLIRHGRPFKEYRIALAPNPRGPKIELGDERTPEGQYILDFKNENSDFYKSIRISYPNEYDLKRAEAYGVDPGGQIMIHGLPNDATLPPSLIQKYNWTDGCIAVTNAEMDEIWAAIELGTPIDIVP